MSGKHVASGGGATMADVIFCVEKTAPALADKGTIPEAHVQVHKSRNRRHVLASSGPSVPKRRGNNLQFKGPRGGSKVTY